MPDSPSERALEDPANRFVAGMGLGRVLIDADSVRFHRAGRGRGRTLLADGDSE
jgi:hypothetical protein